MLVRERRPAENLPGCGRLTLSPSECGLSCLSSINARALLYRSRSGIVVAGKCECRGICQNIITKVDPDYSEAARARGVVEEGNDPGFRNIEGELCEEFIDLANSVNQSVGGAEEGGDVEILLGEAALVDLGGAACVRRVGGGDEVVALVPELDGHLAVDLARPALAARAALPAAGGGDEPVGVDLRADARLIFVLVLVAGGPRRACSGMHGRGGVERIGDGVRWGPWLWVVVLRKTAGRRSGTAEAKSKNIKCIRCRKSRKRERKRG